MTSKGRFGGESYKPKVMGPEPAAAPAAGGDPAAVPLLDLATLAALKGVKVPFASRITLAADRQLKALAKEGEGRTQTELLGEALNLLFEKNGRDPVA